MLRAPRGLIALFLAIATWCTFVGTSMAQVAFVTPSSTSSVEISSLIERGMQLETQRRWGEALTIYEEGLRSHPNDTTIEQRFGHARAHYDLARRYTDASYRSSLSRMGVNEALDLYGEVLLKVQSHYVNAPDWGYLADHGTNNFEVALTDPVFVEHNLPRMEQGRIDRFRRDLRARLTSAGAGKADSRQAARLVAATTAKLAREQLGLQESVVVLEYVCGATNALDAYSTFLTAGQLNEVYSQIEGNFVGLGVELKASEGSLLIVKVIAGSPAQRGGIVAGDRIVAVDGRTTTELSTDQAANMLQGKEGTTVQVTAVSAAGKSRNLQIRREQVEVPSIDDAHIIDPTFGVAYLKLTCFQKTTSRDLDAALWKLHRDGMKSLIIDLRGNPG